MRLARVSTVFGIGAVLAAAPLYSQENEPNDAPATATPVERGTSRRATISPYDQVTGNRDVDYWKITANAGETIFVDIDANEFVFFSSRRRHTIFDCDWSSDVCSSD